MPRNNWTYMLRLLRNPDRIRIDRLAGYMQELGDLLGLENEPVFRKIVNASTGIAVAIPSTHEKRTRVRIHLAQTKPESRPGRSLRNIEAMLGEDAIKAAELRTADNKVIYLFHPNAPDLDAMPSVQQDGIVDGTVTGLVGADDTLHLHVRDMQDRDLRFVVRDEAMARKLLKYFRNGFVRLYVHGAWRRTEQGWVPDGGRCTVDNFEVLDAAPLSAIFDALALIPGNGWLLVEDPEATWRDLRGVN